MRRTAVLSVLAAIVGLLLFPASAHALTVGHAELSAGHLRVDGAGAAPLQIVTVESASSFASVRSEGSGAFHVDATGFRSDDCRVVVSDRQSFTRTVALTGCTPTPANPPSTTPAPTGSCVIVRRAAATYRIGVMKAFFFTTRGCRTFRGPVQWSLLGGHIPTGMAGPYFQGQTAGMVMGRPTVPGSYRFMVKVRDSAGQTDAQIFAIRVVR